MKQQHMVLQNAWMMTLALQVPPCFPALNMEATVPAASYHLSCHLGDPTSEKKPAETLGHWPKLCVPVWHRTWGKPTQREVADPVKQSETFFRLVCYLACFSTLTH